MPRAAGRVPCAGAASPGLAFGRLIWMGTRRGGLRVAEQQQRLFAARKRRRRSRRKRVFGRAVHPSPTLSFLPPSFPGARRDFSRQRHLTAWGRILRSPSCSGGKTGLSSQISGFGHRKATLACGARPHMGVPGRARSRLPLLLRKEGARGLRQLAAAKSALLSAHPLLEQLLTSAEMVSLAFSKWLFQGEHQLSARAEAFGSF